LKKTNDTGIIFDDGFFKVSITPTKSHFHLLEWWTWLDRKRYSLIFEQRANAEKYATELIKEKTGGEERYVMNYATQLLEKGTEDNA